MVVWHYKGDYYFLLCTNTLLILFQLFPYLSSFDAKVFASIIFSGTSSSFSSQFYFLNYSSYYYNLFTLELNISFSVITLVFCCAFVFCQFPFPVSIFFVKYHMDLSLEDRRQHNYFCHLCAN